MFNQNTPEISGIRNTECSNAVQHTILVVIELKKKKYYLIYMGLGLAALLKETHS